MDKSTQSESSKGAASEAYREFGRQAREAGARAATNMARFAAALADAHRARNPGRPRERGKA